MRRALPNHNVAQVCVVGVGRSGGTAINQLMLTGQSDVHYLSLQTDASAFTLSKADSTILLGDTLLKGLGTKGDPRLGSEAVKTSRRALQQALAGFDIVIIVAGLGGGTGSGATPLVAQLAKRMGILTIAVITTPFSFETQTRQTVAAAGQRALHYHADTILTLENDRLLKLGGGQLAAPDATHPAVDIVVECLNTIVNFLCPNGILKVDIDDLRSIMAVGGSAFIARGQAAGSNRALLAAEQATISQQLGATVSEAKGILIQIRGGNDLSLAEVEAAAAYIRSQMDEDIDFTMGAVIEAELGDTLQVSLIATGMQRDLPLVTSARKRQREPAPTTIERSPQTKQVTGRFAPQYLARPIARA